MATVAGADGPGAEQAEKATTFNIGTRKSKLALVQTDLVVSALSKASPESNFVIKSSDAAAGDVDKVTPFKDMAVKNIWTHELETLMIEGELDILVHSLKDVPTVLPSGCEIGGTLQREDPRDALVVKAGREPCKIGDLPPGSVIGTSSIRRTAQIALRYPHLIVRDLRGNLGTRLNKLDAEDGPFDAIILAAAGLIRIDQGHRITQYLDSKSANMLYAVGQGAIGIENKTSNSIVRSMIDKVNHTKSFLAVTAERSLLRTIEGGCSAPLGVETTWLDDEEGRSSILQMKAIVVSLDGKESSAIEKESSVRDTKEADTFGRDAAAKLIEMGAGKILAEIRAKKPTTAADLEEN